MNRSLTVAATMLAGIAALTVAPAPAHAANLTVNTTGARAYWNDAANSLTATDTAPDGDAAVAQLRRPNGDIVTVVASGGSGTSATSTISIAEDVSIAVRACRRSSGAITGCSGWVGTAS